MPEVGLVSLARHAVTIARTVLPRYRSKFSKHQFTQPQLLALLCVMRYEDWTFREAEVRLREHRELRRALGLRTVPNYTTLYRFLHRVDETALRTAVGVVAQHLQRGRCLGATVALDGTGLTAGAVSPYFIRRTREHGGDEPRTWTHWLKWLIVIDVDTQALLTQEARRGPYNDSATLRPMIDAANAVTPITRVLADAEFDSELNYQHVRALGATSVIPAKRGKATWRRHGVRAQMWQRFPRRQYRRRNLIESVFSAIKRKLSTRAPGRSLLMQRRQAFLLGLTFNLYRLRCRRCRRSTDFILRMSTKPDNL